MNNWLASSKKLNKIRCSYQWQTHGCRFGTESNRTDTFPILHVKLYTNIESDLSKRQL